MTAAEIRAQEVLKRLPTGVIRGVEVGVARGEMSYFLLRRPDLQLIMIDSYLPTEQQPTAYIDTGDPYALLSRDEQRANRMEAVSRTDFARDRRWLLEMSSVRAAALFEARFFDFVFIDADHSYPAVLEDINVWMHKVAVGGLLCGHDYGDSRFGVKEAVDEMVREMAWALELGENATWFVRM